MWWKGGVVGSCRLRSTGPDLRASGTLCSKTYTLPFFPLSNACIRLERHLQPRAYASYPVMYVMGRGSGYCSRPRLYPSVVWIVPYAGMHHLAHSGQRSPFIVLTLQLASLCLPQFVFQCVNLYCSSSEINQDITITKAQISLSCNKESEMLRTSIKSILWMFIFFKHLVSNNWGNYYK